MFICELVPYCQAIFGHSRHEWVKEVALFQPKYCYVLLLGYFLKIWVNPKVFMIITLIYFLTLHKQYVLYLCIFPVLSMTY